MRPLMLALLLFAAPAVAQDYAEPARGTALRQDLLDAIRPHAEWALGAPVEFVVWELRVAGDVAFASLWAQRPGGGQIDLNTAPSTLRGELDATVGDGPMMQALLQREGRMWVAVHIGISPSDVWWAYDPFCPLWAPVIPEVCGN